MNTNFCKKENTISNPNDLSNIQISLLSNSPIKHNQSEIGKTPMTVCSLFESPKKKMTRQVTFKAPFVTEIKIECWKKYNGESYHPYNPFEYNVNSSKGKSSNSKCQCCIFY